MRLGNGMVHQPAGSRDGLAVGCAEVEPDVPTLGITGQARSLYPELRLAVIERVMRPVSGNRTVRRGVDVPVDRQAVADESVRGLTRTLVTGTYSRAVGPSRVIAEPKIHSARCENPTHIHRSLNARSGLPAHDIDRLCGFT